MLITSSHLWVGSINLSLSLKYVSIQPERSSLCAGRGVVEMSMTFSLVASESHSGAFPVRLYLATGLDTIGTLMTYEIEGNRHCLRIVRVTQSDNSLEFMRTL